MQSSVLLAVLVSAAATSDVVCRAADDGSYRASPCPSRAEMSSARLRSADVLGLALADVVNLDFFSAVVADNNLGGTGPDVESARAIRYQGARVSWSSHVADERRSPVTHLIS